MPENICFLLLNQLYLNGNKLTALPHNITLPSLEILNVQENLINILN